MLIMITNMNMIMIGDMIQIIVMIMISSICVYLIMLHMFSACVCTGLSLLGFNFVRERMAGPRPAARACS